MTQSGRTPSVAAPKEKTPAQHIVDIWKKSTGTKKHGDLEPGVYALFDAAYWVASELDAIRDLADPHHALKMVRAELGQLAARAALEYGGGVVQVAYIAVEIEDRYRAMRAVLNLERGTWRYTEKWKHRPGLHPAEVPGTTDTGTELKRRWGAFLSEMTREDTYDLKIDQRLRAATHGEIERLAQGPGESKRTGAPLTDAALFTEWLLRTVQTLGLRVPNGRELELLGDDAGVTGFKGAARRTAMRKRSQTLATMIRRATDRISQPGGRG